MCVCVCVCGGGGGGGGGVISNIATAQAIAPTIKTLVYVNFHVVIETNNKVRMKQSIKSAL